MSRLNGPQKKKHRNINELLVEAVTAVAPVMDSDSPTLRIDLAHLAYLNDAALWQAARAAMSAEQRERIASLHDKAQREGLSEDEQSEESALLKLYRETLLIRAQAALLLQQRNYDISDPTQFHPLD